MRALRSTLLACLSLLLPVVGLAALSPSPAAAAPSTGLVISEVFGGGGNNGSVYTHDFVELHNPTASPISVAGWSVQYRSATGTSPTITALTGSVPAGGRYLIQQAAGTGGTTALPTPDATGTAAMSGTSGVVLLVNNTTGVTAQGDFANAGNPAGVVDTVGYGASATTFETANTATNLTSTTSAQRAASGADTDHNNNDFSEAAPAPQNSAGTASPLSATNPGNKSGSVGNAISPFTMTASGGTSPYTWSDPGTSLPPGVTVASGGLVSGTPTTDGTYNVTLRVTDSASPTPATAETSFVFTVSATPTGPTPIADIQGSGGTSPLVNTVVTAQGVVTAKYPTGGFNGFYMQTPGADSTPGRSDAIFVFTPSFDDASLTIGESVEVTGTVKEFSTSGANTLTEIEASAVNGIASLGAVVPNTVIPGTDCALPGDSCPSLTAIDAAKEEFEGELFTPTGAFTVSDVYDGSVTNPPGGGSSSNFGEISLAANSEIPLVTPTEVIDAQATAAIAARRAYNDAHRVVLDDGSSTTFWNTTNTAAGQNGPLAWHTLDHTVRIGAPVTFPAGGVILENRFGWKIQPTTTVVGAPTAAQPQFAQDRPATPADVGGDLTLATFNVLNYFTTLGANVSGCTAFNDRAGNPIAVNSCPGSNGPRGAWNNASFLRQQAKIVNAINLLDADIVSLEEIENSRKVDSTPHRDEAVAALVTALNAAAGSERWAFVSSPGDAGLPTVAEEDVIRTAFIYNPATVDLVGVSKVLVGESAFNNAREPLAQAFKAKGAADADGFAVVANHFKSKGSGADDGTGQGLANPDRVAQSNALKSFAEDFADERGVSAIFLTGDFNAYTAEDPMQVFSDDPDYNVLSSTDDPDEETYSFDGFSGSLDHVVANDAANAMVTGVDIWETNANETVFRSYSRFNYVGTALYDESVFAASDHNPKVVGIDVPDVAPPTTTDVQILGTNDFHGRLLNDTGAPTAGAAVLAGAVKQLRAANPNTVFAAAGDLIGASTFESFIAKDKPTIDVLNEAGLEVSAAGNHEFDAGYDDLVDRVMAPEGPDNPEGGAEWEYIAANLRFNSGPQTGDHALAPSWTKDFGSVKVGFVGAVTEQLPSLVSPAGIAEIDVTDVVTEVNAAADDLVADGADVVVLLVHEGAPSTNCTTIGDLSPSSDFGSIVKGVNPNIDAIVSGHTHLAYNCSFPVPAWVSEGRDVTTRPVVSAGQYGMALNQLNFTVDNASGDVVGLSQNYLPLKAANGGPFNYPVDGPTKEIVDAAVAEAAVRGAEPLGNIGGPFFRGKLADGTTENRGAESTLGNLVAEVQRWATRNPEQGAAQIAFMNPGGLRADMTGDGSGAFPRVLTFRQAANVQPFANTLVNMDLTGAQIKTVLEQQWQPDGASRPFLKLGISKGFTYTYDPTSARGSRITGMWLDGAAIAPASTYSVTVNSFLASGGDNFTELNNGANKADTGQVDLQAMVDYMDTFGSEAAGVPVDYEQNSVGITFPPSAPASYAPGQDVEFAVSSWSMTNAADVKDSAIQVKLGDTVLGTATLDNTPQSALPGFDEVGKALVDVVLPPGTPEGPATLTLVGADTGTEREVDITVDDAVESIQILGTNDFHGRLLNDSGAPTAGAAVLAGAVKQLRGENPNTVFAAAGDLIGASTFESFIAKDKPTIDVLNEAGLEVSAAGNHEFDAGYDDLVNRVMAPFDADTNPFGGAEWEYIAANVRKKTDNSRALAPTWTQTFGTVEVGFVGAVTEDLPSLVSPAGISEITVTDIVTEVNASANDLVADGADIVVLLVHEGAPSTQCETMDDDPTSRFGEIVTGVNANIDAVVSGHTHLAYNCAFTVPAWVTEGRAVTTRPVVSAGQYGMALNQLVFDVDTTTGDVVDKSQALLPLKAANGGPANYPADPATKAIVDAAVADAETLGAQPLGQIAGPLRRGYLANGTTENRGAESTLGNLVAEIQQWATSAPESGGAQIAFMNPGGLRADMLGTGPDAFPRTLTFKQAATVQPFANTLVNMDLTGAQIKAALEQQWQPAGSSRPFLKLGVSEGFTYTSDPSAAAGSRITGMWLDGEAIDPTATYSVTVNSFLASGGDNFAAFNGGTGKADTGKIDLQSVVDYLAEFAGEGDPPLPVPTEQNGIGVDFPVDAPASYTPGERVRFDVSGWSFTNATDPKDSAITVELDGTTLDTFGLENSAQGSLPGFDITGTATVNVLLPPQTPAGPATLVLSGPTTGSRFEVPIEVAPSPVPTVAAPDTTVRYGQEALVDVLVTATGLTPTGLVDVTVDGVVLGTAPVEDGTARVSVPARSLPAGSYLAVASYSGDGEVDSGSDTFLLTATKATSDLSAKVRPGKIRAGKTKPRVNVVVDAPDGVVPTGLVKVKVKGQPNQKVSLNRAGKAKVKLAAFGSSGKQRINVVYLGDDNVQRSSRTVTVTVD